MSLNHNHPFHMVNMSPWPILGAFMSLLLLSSLINWFHFYSSYLLWLSLIVMLLIMYQWWRDITMESTMEGTHTLKILMNLKWGMILFIISELMLFVSFFWAFFHNSLSPNIELNMEWPPSNIATFNPFNIPLLNTMILLSSGFTVTWAHHSLLNNNYNQTYKSLLITILLGGYFSLLQMYEYLEASFSISDSIYGSSFFLATGFHGIHVIIGTSFLFICWTRHKSFHFSSSHHFGLEAAIWYWHFVDVIWLFLYISIYWWGN